MRENRELGDLERLADGVYVVLKKHDLVSGQKQQPGKEHLHTRPTKWRRGTIRVCLTVANTRSVRGDEPQFQSQCELVVKSSDISSEAHAHTAKHSRSVGVTNLGEGDSAPCLGMANLLGQPWRAEI